MNPERTIPDFFLVGAAKAGTTALWRFLDQHPAIRFCPIKEPNYFATDIDPSRFRPSFRRDTSFDISRYIAGGMKEHVHSAYVRDREQYEALFAGASGEGVTGEASVSYLWSREAASNIHAYHAGARILMILRDPAERAFSHYLMSVRAGDTKSSFREALREDERRPETGWGISHLYIELSAYQEKVKRYLDRFGRDAVLVLFYENFRDDPACTLQRAFRFLGVDDEVPIETEARHNPARMPRFGAPRNWPGGRAVRDVARRVLPADWYRAVQNKFYTSEGIPKLGPDDRAFVQSRLRSDIEGLSSLLGRDLSDWLA